MKSYNEMKENEVESTKTLSINKIKINIFIYKTYKFLFSDFFTFMFLLIPLGFIAYFYDFKTPVIIAMLILQPILFLSLNKPLNKLTGLDETDKELELLIKINKEILEEKKLSDQNKKKR
jgi:hypothetical protein